mmetsp:Transcript_18546/g.27819  ORF Transcript_18546/g.27819 Transcript_18546/m.27819 type:complete len:572 (-) Transcript_18546:378-2093(-)
MLSFLRVVSLWTAWLSLQLQLQLCLSSDAHLRHRAPKPIKPDPRITTNQFNRTASFRQNFCDLQQLISRGDLELKHALRYRSIRPIFLNTTEEFMNFRPDGSVDESNPGLYFVLMDELARRGGFTWKESFALDGRVIEGKSYTDLLVWHTDTYDVSVSWWLGLSSRSELGVSFPKGFYDASIIIIGNTNDPSSLITRFNFFSWSAPFGLGVWLFLVATLILTAFIYMLLEESDWRTYSVAIFCDKVFIYLYKAFLAFCGHVDINAQTKAGGLVSISLSFFALLMLSSYTANLVGFLVQQKIETNSNIQTVEDIVNAGLTMCILGDSAKHQVIKQSFPNSVLHEVPTEKDVFVALNKGLCNYAITAASAWEEFERSDEINSKCNLFRVGKVFRNYEAGFASKVDVGNYCTSLLKEVLHLHLLQMSEDGFLRNAWENYLEDRRSNSCSTNTESENETKLVLDNVGSVFIVHYVLLFIAVIIGCVGSFYNTRIQPDLRQSFYESVRSKEQRELEHHILKSQQEFASIKMKLDAMTSILKEGHDNLENKEGKVSLHHKSMAEDVLVLLNASTSKI